MNYEQVYMFIYSRRKGTPADQMADQIPEETKHKRFEKLKQIVENQIPENNKKYINTKQTIIVERKKQNKQKNANWTNRDK